MTSSATRSHRGLKVVALGATVLAATLHAGARGASAQPAAPAAAPAPCTPEGGLKFVCGVGAPEDLAALPGTNWIVTGSLPTDGTGGLFAIDSAHPVATRIFPAASAKARPDLKMYPDCATPPDPAHFGTVGLSARPRPDGGAWIYAVGVGGRQAIEVFELDVPKNTSGAAPVATWIGCVLAPPGSNLNAVAAMFPGEILTTSIAEAPLTFADVRSGKPTGVVYARTPGQPFRKMAGTALSGNNGIEVTRDHKYMFVNATGTRQVLRYERTDLAKPPVVVDLDFGPDNLRGSRGGILIAGGAADPACPAGQKCPGYAVVVSLDPETMKVTPVARFLTTPHWGGLSGALIVGDTLWLGAHQGDRVAYRPLVP